MDQSLDPPGAEVWCVELQPALPDVTITEEALAVSGAVSASWINIETRRAILRVFVNDRREAETLAPRLAESLQSWKTLFEGPLPSALPRAVPRRDWAECWKEHFHTFRASSRIVVKPSWETHRAEPHDLVIELDPGMCFGTGYHGTTRACLIFLDDLAAELGPVSLLDVGCGSGILSLAAAQLGYGPIEAVDIDPAAIQVARRNLRKAGVTGVRLQTADMGQFEPTRHCRVVAANVLAHVLKQHRARLLDWVDTTNSPGYLLLAGILSEQYQPLRQQVEQAGAEQIRELTIDEWTSGCFRIAGNTQP